ncbi:hypothetical protein ACPPVT_18310 [Angustibacter sp. McL0619]|uniref:hypothetical protein n=1 Tax=Angustibacter sp. McL0619 TaxID=3415676 RepID=UPI003CF347F0
MLENAADPDLLRQSLQTHRALLMAAPAQNDGSRPDIGKVTSLDVRLDALLDRWQDLDDADQRDLTQVVYYVVRVPDEQDDLAHRDGLDDDAERVDELFARLNDRLNNRQT